MTKERPRAEMGEASVAAAVGGAMNGWGCRRALQASEMLHHRPTDAAYPSIGRSR